MHGSSAGERGGRGEAGTNYRDPVLWKEARNLIVAYGFVFHSSIFICRLYN
jgi:ribosomal protein L15